MWSAYSLNYHLYWSLVTSKSYVTKPSNWEETRTLPKSSITTPLVISHDLTEPAVSYRKKIIMLLIPICQCQVTEDNAQQVIEDNAQSHNHLSKYMSSIIQYLMLYYCWKSWNSQRWLFIHRDLKNWMQDISISYLSLIIFHSKKHEWAELLSKHLRGVNSLKVVLNEYTNTLNETNDNTKTRLNGNNCTKHRIKYRLADSGLTQNLKWTRQKKCSILSKSPLQTLTGKNKKPSFGLWLQVFILTPSNLC